MKEVNRMIINQLLCLKRKKRKLVNQVAGIMQNNLFKLL